MGRRGPLPGTKYGKKPGPVPDPERAKKIGAPKTKPLAPSRVLELLPRNAGRPAPQEAPEDLGDVGRAVWDDVMIGWDPFGVVDQRLDRLAVHRLCELAEDRAMTRRIFKGLGPVLTEPILNSAGVVVGNHVYANPAAGIMRQMDREINALSSALGLHPAARARLGLTVSKAQLAQADAKNILAHMFTKEGA